MSLEQLRIPLSALKALGELKEPGCGPLSPLARVSRPSGPADREALMAALTQTSGAWQWSFPALLDPGLTLAVLVADRERSLLGQYLWTDVDGATPGFQVSLEDQALILSGPLTTEELRASLLDLLDLGRVAEIAPARYVLDSEQLWALLALIDTFGTASALRTAARALGPPPGVTLADIRASWDASLMRPNPGWAVSLAATVAPDQLPTDFAARLLPVLQRLHEAELLTLIEGEQGDPLGEVCLLGEGLDLLCRGLADGGISFGLVRSQQVQPDLVTVARLAGFRTAGGCVLFELSALSENRAELMLIGPTQLVELLDELLSPTPSSTPGPALDGRSPYRSEALLQQLQTAGTDSSLPALTCPECGSPVSPRARFCGSCGKALPATGLQS
ncbi:MAG: zinc ribbon domain-containing protein [Lysobacterales bacterium]